jgi:hypothetical protein
VDAVDLAWRQRRPLTDLRVRLQSARGAATDQTLWDRGARLDAKALADDLVHPAPCVGETFQRVLTQRQSELPSLAFRYVSALKSDCRLDIWIETE